MLEADGLMTPPTEGSDDAKGRQHLELLRGGESLVGPVPQEKESTGTHGGLSFSFRSRDPVSEVPRYEGWASRRSA